ncbi:hypothetical protein Tco_0496013 [Tanacetum coccineum]
MRTLNVTNVAKKCHFARDCFSKTSEPYYKSPMSNPSSVSKGLQPKFTPKFIQSSQHAQSSQGEPKVQKDYKAEYKKMKAKLALLEASPSTSQSSKPFQTKNKGLVAKTDDLLALKQAKLEAVTFQIHNAELTKLDHALQDELKEERKVNENG